MNDAEIKRKLHLTTIKHRLTIKKVDSLERQMVEIRDEKETFEKAIGKLEEKQNLLQRQYYKIIADLPLFVRALEQINDQMFLLSVEKDDLVKKINAADSQLKEVQSMLSAEQLIKKRCEDLCSRLDMRIGQMESKREYTQQLQHHLMSVHIR